MNLLLQWLYGPDDDDELVDGDEVDDVDDYDDSDFDHYESDDEAWDAED